MSGHGVLNIADPSKTPLHNGTSKDDIAFGTNVKKQFWMQNRLGERKHLHIRKGRRRRGFTTWELETPRRLRPFPVLYVIPDKLCQKHKTDYEKTNSGSIREYGLASFMYIEQ
ncbi:MAG TPA: hypothetical protein VGK24_14285 [Candidatus Angelobacter sp.]|jgi:hypothetical protein